MKINVFNILWAFIGVVLISFLISFTYCLFYYNVDEVVISNGKKITEYVRTVLK